MAGKKNQVTLTFAGDSADLEKAFDKVGDSADSMAREVDKASDRVRSSGEGFDRAAEATDTLDTRSMGFRDTITGLQDGFRGLTDDSVGLGERLLLLGMGVGDLASGFTNFLIPQMKSAVTWIGRTRVGMLAQAGAAKVVRGATLAWAAAQRVLNAVLNASPLMKIIGLLTLVGGALVTLWNTSRTFRDIVTGVWNTVWGAIKDVVSWIRRNLGSVWDGLVSALNWAWRRIKKIFDSIVNAARWVGRQVASAWDFITGSSGEFNNRVLTLSRALAGVKGVGSIVMHDGEIVPGAPGQEVPAILEAGEKVTPANQVGARPPTVFVDLGPALMAMIRKEVQTNYGSNVDLALGGA